MRTERKPNTSILSLCLGSALVVLGSLGCGDSTDPEQTAPDSSRGVAQDILVSEEEEDSVQPSDPGAPDDPGSAPEDAAQAPEASPADVAEEIEVELPPPPPEPPTFPHFDALVDAFRGDVNVWARFVRVDPAEEAAIPFSAHDYADTGAGTDFWPASTIKVYTATAALVLLKELGASLDATATFYHHDGSGWKKDISQTFREMIFDSFNCSSNSAYTLLLRFAGVDWLNSAFLVDGEGFQESALMVGYVSDRPWAYKRHEPQRIAISEGAESWERVHEFSGISYSNEAGCTVYNGDGAANCTSPRDLVEHMRRLMFHEQLPDSERFDVRAEDLDWMRYGDSKPVMNNKEACGGPGWKGVSRVLPMADFYHKGGAVSSYRLDVQHVSDVAGSGTSYLFGVATDTGSSALVEKLSEEVARMALTPHGYVHLDFLTDHVNPVEADLMVYSKVGGTLELMVKPFDGDPSEEAGWTPLEGATIEVPAGISTHHLASACQTESGKLHIRGRLTSALATATSDRHFVIVDASLACP